MGRRAVHLGHGHQRPARAWGGGGYVAADQGTGQTASGERSDSCQQWGPAHSFDSEGQKLEIKVFSEVDERGPNLNVMNYPRIFSEFFLLERSCARSQAGNAMPVVGRF